MSSKEVLREKIADARAKESVSYIGVFLGVILLIVGFALISFQVGTGLIIAAIGLFIAASAYGAALGFSAEKSTYLRKLEKLEVSKSVCPKCGKEMSPDFKTCPYCGTKLEST